MRSEQSRRRIVCVSIVLWALCAVIVSLVAGALAGIVSMPYTFSPNTTIESAKVNSDFTTLYNVVNGNLDDANVSSLSEGKTTFSGTGHDHSGTTKGAIVAFPTINGRLTFVSTTQVKLCPFQGNRLYIKVSGVWTAKTIASACITAANTSVFVNGTGASNLGASTLYYVYLFDNSGTTTVDFSTTTHATDATTGMETKSADDTRVLVGMVRTNGSSQFEDDNTLRGVLSYFNRRDIALVNNFTANRSTGSTTYVELNSEIRANFLTWADEAVAVAVAAVISHDTTGGIAGMAIGFDGTNQEDAVLSSIQFYTAGAGFSTGLPLYRNGLSEGFHYATVLGTVVSGNGTWSGGTYTADTTRRNISSLSVRIKG